MKNLITALLLGTALTFAGCNTTEPGDDDDGGGGDSTAASYDADITPVLDNFCGDCHSGAGCPAGPCFATDYSTIASAADAAECSGLTTAECIKVRLEDGSMPRSDASCPLDEPGCITSADVDAIVAWFEDGMPE